jgi:HEAT repeat protein
VSRDPSERLRALRALPENTSSRQSLLEAVGDVSPDVAREALRRLRTLAGPAEVEALRASMLDLDIGIVGDVAALLRDLGDRAAARPAADALRSPSSFLRHKAAVALRELRDESARKDLVRALDEPEAPVRRVTLEALARLPTESSTVAACRRHVADPDPSVRVAAIDALARLDKDAKQSLHPMLRDPDPRVRSKLGGVPDVLDEEALRLLLRDRDPGVRTRVLKGLAAHPRREVSRSVVAALSDEDWHVRRAACDAVVAAQPEGGAEELMRALVDPHPSVRGRALVALERLAGDGLDTLFDSNLDAAPPPLRRALIEILSSRGRSDIALRYVDDPAPDVRIAVAHSLTSDRSGSARAALRLLADDADAAVRNAALVVLATDQP